MTGTGEPPRTDFTKRRGLMPASPNHDAAQAEAIKREAARTSQPHPPAPTTRIKRVSARWKRKCKSCGEHSGFDLVWPWREGYTTFRCRYCLGWFQKKKNASGDGGT